LGFSIYDFMNKEEFESILDLRFSIYDFLL
jgi:hypothetical protein